MIKKSRILAPASLAVVALAAFGSASVAEGTTAAEAACLAAVQETIGGPGGLSVISAEVSEANTVVMVKVPGAEAPWACYASPDGQVSEVSYMGEG
jgi:hypothetical protein